MKRRMILVCMVLICVFLLAACDRSEPVAQPVEETPVRETQRSEPEAEEAEPPEQMQDTVISSEAAAPAEPEVSGETAETIEPEEPADLPEPPEVPYTLRLRAEVSVFDGPGYDHSYVQAIGEDGVYTIVETTTDAESHLWGRLKSGIGWVDLSALETSQEQRPPISVCYAEDLSLQQTVYQEFLVEDSEYTVKLAFRANELLNGVTFSLLDYGEGALAVDQTYVTLHEMAEETYLIVGVVFYGDMTTYGISFEDSNGVTHDYAVSISGRNGELELNPYGR